MNAIGKLENVKEDFNPVVGEGREDRVVGKFGLGKRNDRG